MKDVVLDEVNREEDKKLRIIFENICRYFNQDKKIITDFKNKNNVCVRT